jgi:hypothetical protein
MDNIVDVVNKLLKVCKISEIEIEARIRKQLVSKESQQLLINNLGVEWITEVYTEKRRISKSNRKCVYRQRNKLTICKSSIAREDINDVWCALHVSVETPTPSMSSVLTGVSPISVTRQRAELENHYIDIVYDEGQGYRIEVEVCNSSNFDPESALRVIRRVCAVLQGSKEFIGYYDWFTVVHITRMSFGPFCIDSGYYQKPQTMTMTSLLELANAEKWTVTPKVDGERRFIVGLDEKVFSVGLLKEVRLEGGVLNNEGIFVLDCEYTTETDMYYVFDAVVKNGKYLGEKEPLHSRLEIAEELLASMSDDLRARINIKKYHLFDSFDKLCDLYDKFKKNDKYKIDGIIFANKAEGYMQQVPKWKPQNTVDLMVTKDKTLVTCDGYTIDRIQIATSNICEGIWEFSYNKEENTLVPERPRPDKPQANSKKIVEKNMLHAIPESVFTGVGCYLMRKYHNRVKRQMIRQANDKDAVILDVGTGQGGDVDKWKRAEYVYCIEPAWESSNEMFRRYGESKKIEIINRCLRDLDHNLINRKVDIFTVFFCMNQFEDADFKSLQKLIKNKGSKKCRLLAIAITAPKVHKGKCFEIRMKDDERYHIDIYNTRISKIDERKVSSSKLTKIMSECGMKLVKQDRLDNNNFMTIEERMLSPMYESFMYNKSATK